MEDGTTLVRWVRRSRLGWDWTDGVDAPLAEESEAYRVTIAPAGGTARVETATVPALSLSAADREGAVTISVQQIGSHGLSAPSILELPSIGES